MWQEGAVTMKTMIVLITLALTAASGVGPAVQPPPTGPYRVLKTARVGGEGGWDYIYADADGRRLYIPRGARPEVPATDTTPAVPAAMARIVAYGLDSLEPAGEIPETGGNGVAVCPKTGHGFSSSRPAISMFDTKTLKLIKKIDIPQGFGPDGIYCDTFNDRVYVFSHPTKNALVIDARDGSLAGTVDLGGTPEQAVSDGNGTLYVVMQAESNVAVVDGKTMKTTAHLDFAEKGGRCNGLAFDAKNGVLFVACGNSSMTPAQGQPPQPTMVVMSAKDGKILTTLPLTGGSDGAAFNPDTMEAFATLGNGSLTVVKETSPTSFEVEQTLQTMNGARTITLDRKTGHVFTMADERLPAPAPPPGAPAGRGGRGAVIPGSFTILMIGR
jgi:DNA-binding beta-propeller fold protein YncE